MEGENCANPLLLGWIKEWLDQARDRGSKGVAAYKRAYDSMKACPLVLSHPSEAQQLTGIGPKLCDRLTEKLKEFCEENGLPMPVRKRKKRTIVPPENPQPETRQPKRPRKAKPYVPALRSGAYAIIMALSTLDEGARIGLTKAEVIELGQPHCDASFTVPPDPSKHYTAWNSMKTLMEKDLIYEHGRPTRKYLLTEDGWDIARGISIGTSEKAAQGRAPGTSEQNPPSRRVLSPQPLQEAVRSSGTSLGTRVPNTSTTNSSMSNFLDLTDDVSDLDEPAGGSASGWQRQSTPEIRAPHQENSTFPSSVTATDLITLPHGSFTVELVLDNREVRTVTDRDYISNELIKKGITPIVRSLELGDSMWVAKCKDPTFLSRYGEEGDEVVLDWIVERKRVDDLVGSIKDGRFYEQKFRLRRSGVRNVIYLIEEFAITETYGPGVRFQDSIESAIASTQVVNDYFVKRTRNLDDTIRYLARMTSLLRDMYTGSASSTSQTSISIVPTRTIDSVETYLQLLNRFRVDEGPRSGSRTYSTTFTTFSSLSSKSDMLTLRDVFLKMLMCTRGVTGTKAIEIQRRWSTPRDFIEAFESMAEKNPGNKAAVEDMVASRLSGLVGPKKMGRALSQKISQVWGPHS